MTVKRGLGRGLNALLGEERPPESADGLQQIPIADIRPNPNQPRTHFDAQALEELGRSIERYGVLVPIIVRRIGEGYELLAGERRWRASAAIHKPTIPAIVRAADDQTSLEVAIIENLQRQDLGAIEEAMGFAHLMEEYAFTQEQVAERVGKSRPAISNALRLLTLSPAIQAHISCGELSAGHARALLSVSADRREALAEKTIREGLSVRALEDLLRTAPERKPARHKASRSADDGGFEEQLRLHLGTHVALKRSGKGGKIEIRYADESELIRVAEVLLGRSS